MNRRRGSTLSRLSFPRNSQPSTAASLVSCDLRLLRKCEFLIIADMRTQVSWLRWPGQTPIKVYSAEVLAKFLTQLRPFFPDLLRSACDLIHLFYVFEEQTDESHAMRSQTLANIVLDAMSRPEHPRPDGEPIVGEVARQCVYSWHSCFFLFSGDDHTCVPLCNIGSGCVHALALRPREWRDS